jgi:hypothetical protein
MTMKAIRLTQGQIAIVDDDDYPRLAIHKWCATRSKQRWYAVRRDGMKILFMHRVILGAVGHVDVDHRDGHGLHNCRSNLRIATRQENSRNQTRLRERKTARFRGVSLHRSEYALKKPWRATIKIDGVRIHLGYYASEEEAARAYDAAAVKHFGDFASPNFPKDIR